MLRRTTGLLLQSRGLKKEVNIKWVRPDYVPAYKPERSGDLEGLPDIPKTTIGKYYALSEEMKDANDFVKKIFSIEILGMKERNQLVRDHFINRVKRHSYDEWTVETHIARLTASIRYLQEMMENSTHKNIKIKQVLQEIIDCRKKHLSKLRENDYKKFEWLLEKLNIEYKAHPESPHKLSRKESLRRLTEMHCDDVRNKKLDEYRSLLESQQGPFLKNKLETLKFIRNEQIELKLQVTVTEQDINKVAKMLEEWTVKDDIKKQSKKKRKHIILE